MDPRRIRSIDLVRGVAMVVMALDHVRVYAGVPAGGPTPGLFFTRWVTHVAAPAFVFLAGVAAHLHGKKLANRAALARFLAIRGAWLVVLELTAIRIAWTFDLDFAHYLLGGVIWVIGLSMIALAGAIFLPRGAVIALALAIIGLHNVVDLVAPIPPFSDGPAWRQLLYTGGAVHPPLFVLYSLVPWVGVMLAGHAFGPVLELAPERRRALCLRLGLALIAAFVALRVLDGYGDPRPWSGADRAFAFLDATKYPASLAFLLMTLGPILVGLGLAERATGRVAGALATLGRVPLFYYLLHIPLIHLAACAVSLARTGAVEPWLFGHHPVMPGPPPDGYAWSLPLLYAVWVACVVALYPLCRWFARVRPTRPWLAYL